MANSLADTLQVLITGDATGLQAALAGAAAEVETSSVAMSSSFGGLGAALTSVTGLAVGLGAALAAGALFGDAIEKTNQMTREVRDLSTIMGINTRQAAGLKQALAEIGLSTDTYTQAFIKFDRAIKQHADQVAQLVGETKQQVLQTTDSNALFTKAVAVLGTFQAGQQRNIVAMELFGRSVTDVLQLLRLHNDAIAEATQRATDLGLVVTNQNIQAYNDWTQATAQLKETSEGFSKAISDALLPIFTEFVQSLANAGVTVLPAFRAALEAMAGAFSIVEAACVAIVDPIIAAFNSLVDAAVAAAHAIAAAFQGSMSDAVAAVKSGLSAIKGEFAKSDAAISSQFAKTKKLLTGQGDSTPYSAPSGNNIAPDFSKAKKGGGAGKANKEELQMAEELANEEKTLELQKLADKKTIADAEVQLGLKTKEQELQQEQGFEDEKYQIEKTALDKKLAAMQNDPDSNPVMKQKILDQLLTLQATHESAILKLKIQTYEESQKLNQEATKSIEGDFETLFSSVISGQKTLAQAFNDFVNSVTQAISKLAAQYLAQAIFGGSSGGGGFGSIISSIFGGGGGASGLTSAIGGTAASTASSGGLFSGIASLFGGALATGGDVSPGMAYTVGENGAETFVPSVEGSIVPRGASLGGGGVSVSNNFTINGTMSQANQQQIAYQVGRAVKVAMARNG